MFKVAIILLNYNSYDDSVECIQSLKQISYPNYEIIVVDNHSSDDSGKRLEQIEGIHFIQSPKNGGFAYGNNIGIRYALERGADYVLLLNNDTMVEKDFLDRLMEKTDQPEIGIIAPKILNYYHPHLIWSLGGTINWNLFVGYNGKTGQEDEHQSVFEETEFVNGCCMLIKKEVFETIGYLPEDYFMYYEDLDFCMQVKEKYQIYVNSDAIIYHKISASSGEDSPFQLEWVTRSQIRFMEQYRYRVNPKQYQKNRINVYARKWFKIMMYALRFDYSRAHAIYKGLKKG